MLFLNLKILWHLLWVFPLILVVSRYAFTKRDKALEFLLGARKHSPDFVTLSSGARTLRTLLFISAILFIFLAAARPSWGKRILPFTSSGRDIIIAADLSKSMLASDIQPSRLEHLKWILREIISSCQGDRFGIVAFSGTAFLECPLTVDKTTLIQSINELTPDYIPHGGTNIEAALKAALTSFQSAEGEHRAVVLLSDGDELQGNSLGVIEELKKHSIPVFVVGIGNPAQKTPISIRDAKNNTVFLRDSKGEIVNTSLNEKLLRKIAIDTNGIYIRSTSIDPQLKPVLQRIKQLVPEKYEAGNNTRPIERFQIPLVAATILLLAAFAIGERRKKRGAIPISILFIMFCGNLMADTLPISETSDIGENANTEIKKEADKINTDKNSQTLQPPKKPYQIFNEGLKKQTEKDFNGAINLYEYAAGSSAADAETQKKSYQNLGTIKHIEGRQLLQNEPQKALDLFASAEKMYKEAIKERENTADAIQNQQILLNDIETAKKNLQQQQEQEKMKQNAKEQLQKAAQENKDATQKPQDEKEKNQAKEQSQKAQKSLEDYKEKAQKNNQKEEQKKTENAEKELQQAKNEQKNNNFEKAQKHLEEAIKEFSKGEEKEKGKSDEKKDEQQENKDDNNKEKKQAQPISPQKEENKNMDPAQAAALLDLMAQDEKDLRDAIKEKNKEDAGILKVDKDW